MTVWLSRCTYVLFLERHFKHVASLNCIFKGCILVIDIQDIKGVLRAVENVFIPHTVFKCIF